MIRTARRVTTARPAALRNERGAIIVFMAVSLVIMLAMAGLAIDLGAGYLRRARMVRAVDAAALAGARVIRDGQPAALNHALAIAQSNGLGSGVLNPPALDVQFGMTVDGETTIQVSARDTENTLFARIFGQNDIEVAAMAQAATPPVDIVLVIDHSGSLGTAMAWVPLQDAAKSFVDKFDDDLDQMGMVGFHTKATQRFAMSDRFTAPVKGQIDALTSAGWTNTGQALRLASDQFGSGAPRARSAKVVVFFTDGRPTAFRDFIGFPAGAADRIMAVSDASLVISGYWDDPDGLAGTGNPPPVDGCDRVTICFGNITGDQALQKARDDGAFWASQIRGSGVYIYTIGLGNTVASYLAELANEGGIADANQLQGRSYIAPTAADLQAVFDQVAADIFVRLAQ